MGVYRIVHRPTGKVYIGSSFDISIRIAQHRMMLRQQDHHCRKLQELVDTDGFGSLEVSILAETPDVDVLRQLERVAIAATPADDLLNTTYAPKPEKDEAPAIRSMTGTEFKEWRIRRGFSQRAFAARIGYNHAMISLWESGKRSIPGRVTLILQQIDHEIQDDTRMNADI